jgi:cytochrome c(L)
MIGRTFFCLLSLSLALNAPTSGVAHAGAGDIDTAGQAGSPAAANAENNPYTGDAVAIEEGRKLWRQTGCYSCHGGVAEGGVGPSLIDDEWIYVPTDKTIFKAISEGRRGTVMVAWSKDLNPDQIWKLVTYIRSLYEGDPEKIIW